MFNYSSRQSPPTASSKGDSPPRNGNVAPPMHELGGMLRKRREALGATLNEVETATKIRQKYLAALEADEWQLLPGEVVGRGFLRNYATYLGLEPTELIERRRTVADPTLASALANTSEVAPLPPPRVVDYRPKEVPLHEEQSGIEQRREIRLGPILTIAGMVVLLLLFIGAITIWGGRITGGISTVARTVQSWGSAILSRPTAALTEPALVAHTGDSQNNGAATPAIGASENTTSVAAPPVGGGDVAAPGGVTATTTSEAGAIPLPTPTPNLPTPTNTAEIAPTLTDTPAPSPTFTNTPLPSPTPTDTPADTPTPTAPPIVPPVCADPRSVLTTPGENQVISGVASVTGRASHEAFSYYKLEFAPGAGAGEGYVYFDGANSSVEGGVLGNFNSTSVGNGAYTLRLTVVDLTGNFPPPCQVTIFVQN